jgi:hypothetical protein
MPDWTASMQQTFEYRAIDPATWKEKKILDNIKSCTIERDSEADTLGSATIDVEESTGECYIRVYLVTIQNGETERFPLGTFLVQTPSSSFDGKAYSISMDAYTPLIELKEKMPAYGYSLPEGENIMDKVYALTNENVRAPVVKAKADDTLTGDFVANTDDTWMSFLKDLAANAEYSFSIDEMGRILFAPDQDTDAMQPVWTFDDSNSSILYPDISLDHDLYGIPNVVEVIYSSDNNYFFSRIVNDDPNSPTSTVNRGREIIYRDTNPSISGSLTQERIDDRAKQLLKSLSTLEYTVSYTHGYCPVRLGDCVRLNYKNAGLDGVKAKVTSQSIKCEPGTPVTEKAVYSKKLWG